jgi:hypothetical protein
MGLLSPQEQEGIIGSAAKAAELQQRGQLIPSEIASRNAQAIHALTQAGLAPQHLGIEQQRTDIMRMGEQLRARTVAIDEALLGAKQELMGAQTDEAKATAQMKVEGLTQQRNALASIQDEQERTLATLDPRTYVRGKLASGESGIGKSAHVARVRAMAKDMGISEADAWEILNKQDKATFVQQMTEWAVKSPMFNIDTLAEKRKEWARIHDEEHGRTAAPSSHLTPAEANDLYYGTGARK